MRYGQCKTYGRKPAYLKVINTISRKGWLNMTTAVAKHAIIKNGKICGKVAPSFYR